MATPATVPVEQLKTKLGEAAQAAAELREKADAAARHLVTHPTHAAQAERNRLRDELELRDLEIEKLKSEIEAAKRDGWQAKIDEAAATQAELKASGEQLSEAVRAALYEAARALSEFQQLRQAYRNHEWTNVSHEAALKGEQAYAGLGSAPSR